MRCGRPLKRGVEGWWATRISHSQPHTARRCREVEGGVECRGTSMRVRLQGARSGTLDTVPMYNERCKWWVEPHPPLCGSTDGASGHTSRAASSACLRSGSSCAGRVGRLAAAQWANAMGWTSWTKGVVSSALGGGKDKSCVPTRLLPAHRRRLQKGQRTPAGTPRTHRRCSPSLQAVIRLRSRCGPCAPLQPYPRSPGCAAARARWEALPHPTHRHWHHTRACWPAVPRARPPAVRQAPSPCSPASEPGRAPPGAPSRT